MVAGRLDGAARRRSRRSTASPNRPVRLPDGLHWNLLQLFTEAVDGLRGRGPLDGVGVDTWGVDYALLDERGRVLGLPFHYRDARTDGMVDRALARVPPTSSTRRPASRRCRSTPSSSCSPTRARRARGAPTRIALVPDLLAYWLSGELANEVTNASTTGLLDARTGTLGARADRAPRAADAAVRRAGRARHGARAAARPPRAVDAAGRTPSPATTPPRPSRPRRCATSTRRSCRAAPGRCSGSSCPRPVLSRRGRSNSPTSAASTARSGCSRT